MERFLEKLRFRDPVWQAIGTVIGVIALVASTVVAYDIYRKSALPAEITVTKYVDFDPLRFSEEMEDRVALLVDGLAVKSVLVSYYSISNTGQRPIRLEDYVEPVQVSIEEPWELLAVGTKGSTPSNLNVTWTRVATNTFEMEPVLLNPNDTFWILLFVTPPSEDKQSPELHWDARIVNVHSLMVKSSEASAEGSGLGPFFFEVYHYGWSVYWIACSAIVMFVISILLGMYSGRLTRFSVMQVVLLVAIMAISISSAEIIVDVLVERDRQWWGSWLLFGSQILLMVYLVWPLIRGMIRNLRT